MENATKALLIAAGVMVGVMILSLLMIGYNEISSYYATREEIEATKQLTEFNKTFENFNRTNIRGTDLITFLNKVIDYNERYAYREEQNYNRITVNIAIEHDGVSNVWRDNMLYPNTQQTEWIINQTQPSINNISPETATLSVKRAADARLIAITNVETDLIDFAKMPEVQGGLGITISADKLQKLAANISNIILDSDHISQLNVNTQHNEIQQRYRRAKLIKDILNIDITYDNEAAGQEDSISKNRINKIQQMARKYYQYQQFKRAYFDCKADNGVIYDNNTGRIERINFEIQLKQDETGAYRVVFN